MLIVIPIKVTLKVIVSKKYWGKTQYFFRNQKNVEITINILQINKGMLKLQS